jgi:hypothetical protein
MRAPCRRATGIDKNHPERQRERMLVIRRMVNRRGGFTVLLLPGEPPRIIPTSDHEHSRILKIYKQDRRHRDVLNDFTDYDLGEDDSKGRGSR